MEHCGVVHHAFSAKSFFRNNNSLVMFQRSFRQNFNVGSRGAVSDRNIILRCVEAVITTRSVIKRKPPPASVQAPEISEYSSKKGSEFVFSRIIF